MAILFSNNASTTISGTITATDTFVALAAGTGVLFPQPVAPDFYVATFYDQATKTVNEIVHCVAKLPGDTGYGNPDVVKLVRAQEGTTAGVWNAGDIFANLITAGTLRAFVQASGPAADTSIVYVGTDTSTTPGIIIANTTPVPASYVIGMLFNIKVNNTNDGRANSHTSVNGAVTLELNGRPYVVAKLSDGHDFIGAELASQHEYIFVYDGVTFSTQLVNAPRNPPQNTFYVRSTALSTVNMTTGLETATGFADNDNEAFKTIQGAMNTLKSRYISQNQLTIKVADGTYTTGAREDYQYISSWNIVGNEANPGNCTIDCRSSNQATYVPGATLGWCAAANYSGQVTMRGFSFLSLYGNGGSYGGGKCIFWNCNFSSGTSGTIGCITAGAGGNTGVYGTCYYAGTYSAPEIFLAEVGGIIGLGWQDNVFPINNRVLNMTFGPCTVTGAAIWSDTGAVIDVINTPSAATFHGGPINGVEYVAASGGGIGFQVQSHPVLPATQPGIIYAPGWVVNP